MESFYENEYNDISADLSHMYRIALTENDIEFLNMKRTMKFRKEHYAPDPRLGDYET